MKTINFAATSAVVVACSLSLAQAAPKAKDDATATQSRAILEQVDSLSASMVNAADKLALGAKNSDSPGTQRDELDTLRADINQIGRDLRILKDEEESLPAWEGRAIDQVSPLMQEIAANTEEAIQNFNVSRNHLWATAFPDETAKIYGDAERVKGILGNNLKLASTRDEEQRIESHLNR